MPRASLTISRTTTSAAQSARGADVKLDSTARHAPSGPSLSPLECAALRAAPSSMLPRSPSSNDEPADTRQESLAISGGRSSRSGLRPQRRPLDESGDTRRSRSSIYAPSSTRMTRVHPTPARGLRLPPASCRGQATPLPFFIPPVTVLRATPKVRDSPRKLLRSS